MIEREQKEQKKEKNKRKERKEQKKSDDPHQSRTGNFPRTERRPVKIRLAGG